MPRQNGLNGSGAGLGLGICQRLARQMGGKIWFEANASSRGGSVFCFSVRCAEESPTKEARGLAELQKEAHVDKRLKRKLSLTKDGLIPLEENILYLVVDDSVLNQKLFIGYLKRLKLCEEPFVFSEGLAALAFLLQRMQRGKIDDQLVLLLDFTMPLMDGEEVVRLWRQLERGRVKKPAKIFLVSATHVSSTPDGVDGLLPKPLTLEQLERQLGKK